MLKKILLCSSLCFCHLMAFPVIICYPSPEGLARSEHYRVEVFQDGTVEEPFVYYTTAQLPKFNKSKTTAYCIFSFTGKITVRVTRLQESFQSCRILPSAYGIYPEIRGNSITFSLDRPLKVSVEFDNDITHPLLIFSDEPESEIPSEGDPDVIYFGPGVHTLEEPVQPVSGQTLYLAGGAYVEGLIRARDVSGVRICGRGILSGRKFGHTGGRHILFEGKGSADIFIEGITIVDSPGFMITTGGPRTHVKNVKGIGWWFNTDGIAVGEEGLVEDCFLKCNDDAIKLYHSGTRVYRTTIWQMENGAPFQISWNMNSDNQGFVVKDCDVIRCDHAWDNTNTSIFNAIHGGSGHMSGYVFEDIRIENCDWRLVSIQVRPNKFSRSPRPGKISDITFRNISVETPGRQPLKRINLIQGYNGESTVSGFVFENLRINGKLIHSAAEGNFEIDPRTSSDIRFICSEPLQPEDPPGKPKHERPRILEWTNPVTNGLNSYGQKDFHIFQHDNFWYLTATEHPNREWGKRGVILYTSGDLIHWREDSYLINRNSLPEETWYRDVWNAPKVFRYGSQFVLVFSCRNDQYNPYGRLGMGLAISDELRGPYRVLTPDSALAIGSNPAMLVDDDGKAYLYWDRDGRIYGAAMDPLNAKFTSEPAEILGPETLGQHYRFLDAPFVMKRAGRYYLLYSSFYAGYVVRIRYMVSDHPLGPWEFLTSDPLMVFYEDEADMELKMPWSASHPFPPPTQVVFHNQIFRGPGNKYFVAWHSSEKYSEPYLMIEPVEFDRKGQIILKAHKEKLQRVVFK